VQDSTLLIAALKRSLKHRGMTYAQLARKLGESEANVKRSFSQGAFSLQRFERICAVAGVSLLDLAKSVQPSDEPESNTFTREQERLLAQSPTLFALFYLLLGGLKPASIRRDYEFTAKQMTQLLIKLDRAALIRLGARDQVRMLVSRNIRWLPQGPLAGAYQDEIKRDFLRSDFAATNERIRLLSGYLSKQSLDNFKLKMDRLIAEFVEYAELDDLARHDQGERIWILVAYRPWVFSRIAHLRRKV
jgi:transcriptional regulator with XRE-family HTH domain